MSVLLEIVVGALTLGLPLWFAYLDRKAFPRLKWVKEGTGKGKGKGKGREKEKGKERGTPRWGHAVVFVGVALAVLIALAAPISGFHPGE
jgi:hypothetical protein